MSKTYILSYKRTPVGSFGGSLKSFTAIELGVAAAKATIDGSGVSVSDIEECYIGNVLSANNGQAPARQVALKSGLPENVPATTINKVCASGLKALTIASSTIQLGVSKACLVGGVESMSNTPYYSTNARFGSKYGHNTLIDGMLKDGLWDAFNDHHMGNAAEHTNKTMGITREEQDQYAIRSYRLAEQALNSGYFDDEITSLKSFNKGKSITIDSDEEPSKVRYEKIPELKPTFLNDGSITPANASSLNDGAAMIILGNEQVDQENVISPLAEIIDFQDSATKPIDFTIAPHIAIKALLSRNGLSAKDIDLFEINEAYANTVIANSRLLNVSIDKINVAGGAVALGHPIGMSGTRIIGTLARHLKNRELQYGIAAICNGGGGATAVLIKNPS